MAHVSGINSPTLPSPSNKSGPILLSGALLAGALAAGGVWLTHRSVAFIPAGALLGAALAWLVFAQKNLPVQVGQFQIFTVEGKERDSVRELVRGWGKISFEKDLDLCLKKYQSLGGSISDDIKDKRSFAYHQLLRMRQLPPQECADHALESSYIAGKLEPTYNPTGDDNPWDTLLASVDSTGTIQAVAIYSEKNNKLVNLVTHPHNIPLPEGEELFGVPTRGAGSSIMRYLFDKSLKSNRPLTLEPADRSTPFFQKFGLQLQPRVQGALQEMKISPEEILARP